MSEILNWPYTCRLIINDCLDNGSQLPYIRKAKALGYNVLVLNTNDNEGVSSDGSVCNIRVRCFLILKFTTIYAIFIREAKIQNVMPRLSGKTM
jgi:hypothetical protein